MPSDEACVLGKPRAVAKMPPGKSNVADEQRGEGGRNHRTGLRIIYISRAA
tara:strand:- start:527 stop:679 length:153 start_codon:yes stop_codon:yes gene_type:complete